MKKPAWISFCGWLALALAVFWCAVVIMAPGKRYPEIPPALLAVPMLIALPAFGLWLLGTIVHGVRVHGARVNAAAMIEAQQRAGVFQLPCRLCSRAPALVRCVEHSLLLCQSCWHKHNSQQHAGAPPVVQTGTR